MCHTIYVLAYVFFVCLFNFSCLSGCIGELPSSVQCKNEGWDGTSVNWRCEANLQRGRRLENTQVRCEAYPDGDKEYILKGSCALSYSLGGHAGTYGL